LYEKIETVDQHVADSAADNHTQHAVKQNVTDILFAPGPPALPRSPVVTDCPKRQERQQVHDAIPMNIQWSERDRNGIDINQWILHLQRIYLSGK
jgi:hypothetical protein